jgi:hypothetical protein
MKCKSLVILLGLWLCLSWSVAFGADDFYVIPVRSTKMRQYYLTQNTVSNATQAPDACANGYHMASIWEIVDPSNLKYNSVFGYTRQDSGSGPPVEAPGWVRTGYNSSVSSSVGIGNCDSWSSSDSIDYGTAIYLPVTWFLGGGALHVWNAQAFGCSYSLHVWCVED